LKNHKKIATRSVVHCFTGTKYEAEDYLELGCYIGVTGWICDDRRNDDLLKAIKVIPPEKLMIETDGPFLMPRDFEQKPKNNRNEPKYLPHILKRIAKEMNIDPEELAKQVTINTKNFFNI
jgi:TatD DNase family protein